MARFPLEEFLACADCPWYFYHFAISIHLMRLEGAQDKVQRKEKIVFGRLIPENHWYFVLTGGFALSRPYENNWRYYLLLMANVHSCYPDCPWYCYHFAIRVHLVRVEPAQANAQHR